MLFTGASQVVLVVKNLPAKAGDVGSIPGLGRSPGVGNVNPLQYSCLENSMERGIWRATVCGIAKSRTQLSAHTHTHTHTHIHISTMHLEDGTLNELMIVSTERQFSGLLKTM